MPDPTPALFRSIPPEDFPFTIEYRDLDSDELIDTCEVSGPGVLTVPTRPEGRAVRVLMCWPDRTMNVFPPYDSEDPRGDLDRAMQRLKRRL